MADTTHSPLKPAHSTDTPVLLPIDAPKNASHGAGILPGIAATLAVMVVLCIATFGLGSLRPDLSEGRSVHIDRPAAR